MLVTSVTSSVKCVAKLRKGLLFSIDKSGNNYFTATSDIKLEDTAIIMSAVGHLKVDWNYY